MTRDGPFKSSVGSFAVFTLYLLAQLFWQEYEGQGHLATRADLPYRLRLALASVLLTHLLLEDGSAPTRP